MSVTVSIIQFKPLRGGENGVVLDPFLKGGDIMQEPTAVGAKPKKVKKLTFWYCITEIRKTITSAGSKALRI